MKSVFNQIDPGESTSLFRIVEDFFKNPGHVYRTMFDQNSSYTTGKILERDLRRGL